MDNLYNYFLKFSNKVYFLTVKQIKIDKNIYKNIDFPINSKILLENIKNNVFIESVGEEYFIEGILLLNGIDPYFNNIFILNKFINSKKINLVNYLNSKIKFNKNEFDDILYNLLIIRGFLNLKINNEFITKLYIKYLLIFLDFVDTNYYVVFLNEIKLLLSDLEKKVNNTEDYLTNVLYGDVFAKEKLYIKADLFYKKALNNSLITDNIRCLISNKISDIKFKVKIEEMLNLTNKFRYEECYKILNEIEINDEKLDKEDLYFIAHIYNKINEIEKSIIYYEKSLDLNADFLNIFIELGLQYYKINEIEKSIEIFKKGLSIYIDDEKLLFNKILLELKIDKYDDAKKDIEKILLYEDIDNSIMNDILYLRELYKDKLK